MAETGSERGFIQPQSPGGAWEAGNTAPRSQHSQVRGCTQSCALPTARRLGVGHISGSQSGEPAGLRQAPAPPAVCHLLPSQREGGVLPPCSAWHCHPVPSTPEEVRHGTPSPQGSPCLRLRAPRAILASSCSLSWPERVGNGVGGQRDAAGSRQADPTLAPLPGASELSSRVSAPRCS